MRSWALSMACISMGEKGFEKDIRLEYRRYSRRIRALLTTIVILSSFFASYCLYFFELVLAFSEQNVIQTVDNCCLEHHLSP